MNLPTHGQTETEQNMKTNKSIGSPAPVAPSHILGWKVLDQGQALSSQRRRKYSQQPAGMHGILPYIIASCREDTFRLFKDGAPHPTLDIYYVLLIEYPRRKTFAHNVRESTAKKSLHASESRFRNKSST